MKKIIAIILAAGESTRMKSDISKVLHNVCGRPIIKHTLDTLKSAEVIDRKILVVGFQAQKVREVAGPDCEYAVQKEQLGTADAVKACSEILKNYDGNVLVLAGDVPLIRKETIEGLIRKHVEEQLDITILCGKLKDPTGYGRIVRKDNERVSRIVEEIDTGLFEKAIEEINSGIYCFRWNVLQRALRSIKKNRRKNEFFLTDVIEEASKEGCDIDTFIVEDSHEILGVNSRVELANAEKILRKRINTRLMEEGVTLLDPDSAFIDADVIIGNDTVIYPFTVIEGNVRIGRNCQIGPFSHIRGGGLLEDGAEIGNFVEVKNCTIGGHTKAKHLTYLGDATIGSGVNIGAGTIIANYDGKKKHRSEIKDGAFIGSGTILISPVTIGSNAITGAGSVVLKNRDVPDGTTVIGVPAKQLESVKQSRKPKGS